MLEQFMRAVGIGCVAVVTVLSPQTQAGDWDVTALQARLNQVLNSPEQQTTAAKLGQQRALLCAYCHGKDGNSINPEVPNLAGQSPRYLLEQTVAYGTGARKDYIMTDMVRKFSEDDVINLTVFYSSQPHKRSSGGDAMAAKQGKVLYQGLCMNCHGGDGRGAKGYAWVAGQQAEYVVEALQRYRRGKGKRVDAEMANATKNLSDKNIRELAEYLASID